ncbi:MAG: class I SAM-dependent methyltransferase [Patescibacteria group bacterium]|nr:class I SAM-dependent methyltransferase [Patescibacteria group bacterium]
MDNFKVDLEKDKQEAIISVDNLIIKLKLLIYTLKRPIDDSILRFVLKNKIHKKYFKIINRFLWLHGGMHKHYVYGICNHYKSLKNAKVLVPGVGYGKNLFQLAAFRPREIVAFDPIDFPLHWSYLQKEIKKIFGVKLIFYKGGFKELPNKYKNKFDFVISDAVLEHVKNMSYFLKKSHQFLSSNGFFYASFGPIWFGPNGDHLNWGKYQKFRHLILDSGVYFQERQKKQSLIKNNSLYRYLLEEDSFSKLSFDEYLKLFKKFKFQKMRLETKIDLDLWHDNKLKKQLDKKKIPNFDRYSKGMFVWFKKR